MSDVFVVRNQHGHYWGKSKAWVSGEDARSILRSRHYDEALNTLFELSSKDVELRGEVLGVALDERGEVVVEPSEIPLPGAELAPGDAVDSPESVTEEAP